MSVIRYRFKSSKEVDILTFEGPGLHVWEVKDEIRVAKKLNQLTDMDLLLTHAQTLEDYTDDNKWIPKNTSLIVKRVPKSVHQMSLYNRQNEQKKQFFIPKGYALSRKDMAVESKSVAAVSSADAINASSSVLEATLLGSTDNEEQRLQAMAKASAEEWNKQLELQETFSQDKLQRQQYLFSGPNTTLQSKIPPSYYVCYRCGEKGHYITDCPLMLANPNDLTRIKRVTGIPKSFLKPIDPAAETTSKHILRKTMISYDGSKVVFTPNVSEWQKFSSLAKQQAVESANPLPVEPIDESPTINETRPNINASDSLPSVPTLNQEDTTPISKESETVPGKVDAKGITPSIKTSFTRAPPPIPTNVLQKIKFPKLSK